MREETNDSLRRRVVLSIVLVFVFLIIGIAVFLIHLGMRTDPAKTPPGPPRTVVRAEVATRAPYQEVLRGYGLARALRRSPISAEVTGLISWICPKLEAGSAVDEGEELVRLDRRDFEQRVEAAEARVRQAKASLSRQKIDLDGLGRRLAIAEEDLETAERELERVRKLVADGVEKKSELDRQRLAKSQSEQLVVQLTSQVDTARSDLTRADAEVAAAEADLARARIDLDRTVVRAPWAGRVETREAELGARVSPGSPLFTLVDLSRVEVPVALSASHFTEIRAGAAAAIRLAEDGEVVWRGEVARVSPTVDPVNRTFLAYLVVRREGEEEPIPPGAFVTAEIDGLRHEGVIAVRRVAFVGDRLYLAEPAADGTARIREVMPEVRRRLPDVVLLSGGVEPGDRVVVTNLEQIADGSRVVLAPDVAGAGPDSGGGGKR